MSTNPYLDIFRDPVRAAEFDKRFAEAVERIKKNLNRKFCRPPYRLYNPQDEEYAKDAKENMDELGISSWDGYSYDEKTNS